MKYLLSFLLVLGLFLLKTNTVNAACSGFIAEPSSLPSRSPTLVTIKSQGDCFATGQNYIITAHPVEFGNDVAKTLLLTASFTREPPFAQATYISEREIKANLNLESGFNITGERYSDKNWYLTACIDSIEQCINDKNLGVTAPVFVYNLPVSVITATPRPNQPRIDSTSITQCKYQASMPVTFKLTNITPNTDYQGWWNESFFGIGLRPILTQRSDAAGSDLTITIPKEQTTEVRQNRQFCVDITTLRAVGPNCITLTFTAQPPTGNILCDSTLSPARICTDAIKAQCKAESKVCRQGDCISTSKSEPEPCDIDGIKTAIGCIHREPVLLVKDLLKFVVGISGGIAFLFMVFGVFQMLTSAGNPDTLKSGQTILTNAIIGLLFIIFSTLLLKIIGVDILNLGAYF